ncbi:MAG: cytochrome c3 family protein [Planctomycetota bacterium]
MSSTAASVLPRLVRRLAASCLLLAAGTLARAQDTAPFPRVGDYVGAAECARCHERQHRRFLSGAHAVVLEHAALPGCETCHGPGRAHAESADNDLGAITMPKALAPAAQTAFCARCHQDQIERHGGDLPGLLQSGRTCTECHEIHGRPDAGPLPGVRFAARAHADAVSDAAGSAECAACHPIRDALLRQSAHRDLAADARGDGCERCHGHGVLHADARGEARLITRPDRAADGVATCRSCHPEVDAVRFHWAERRAPYLAEGVVCATCHRVHEPRERDAATAAGAPHTAGAAATNRACAACHVPALFTMPGSTHHLLGGPDVPLDRGCGSCHAGALDHAERGGRRELVQRLGGAPAAVQAQACMQCHREDEALRGVAHGAHARADVGCADCHGPLHGADPVHVRDDAERSCARCHADVAAEFRQPNHHPVPEGTMHCSSCHDVHRDRQRIRDLHLTQGVCADCHPRHAGPFVFAHQAGRRDGCVACHVPHGGANRRLLRQPNSQQNCLSCHGDFPAFHDQTIGAVFTDCLRCHTEVHGSNHSRFLFR